MISAIVVFETTLALMRKNGVSLEFAKSKLDELCRRFGMRLVEIDSEISEMTLYAHQNFGKGRHKAALNMGDCFSYACAKLHKVPLLFKGDDFALTDVKRA